MAVTRTRVEEETRGQPVMHQTCWEGNSLTKHVFIERGEMMDIRINGTDTVVQVSHQHGVLVEVIRPDEKHSAAFSVERLEDAS